MNDITLIIPPSPFLLDERVFVSLGILRIASAVRAQGYRVGVLDLSGIENYLDVVDDFFSRPENTEPIVGITATTPQMPAAHKIMQLVARACNNERIIIGGPHPTLVNAAAKKEARLGISGRASRALAQLKDDAHFVVAGDGELALPWILKNIDRCGVVDADDPKSPLWMNEKMYEETPFPARDLVNLDSYHYQIDGARATSLIAQLGCPFQCGFCGGRNSPMLRRIRTRSTQSIISELEMLYKMYGYTGFMFYDDEMNVNPGMVDLMKNISALQRRLGVEFKLRGFVKAELFTEEQANVMYDAGFRWLLTGFESGSPRILENINKRSTIFHNTRAVEIARQAGLKVKALMSVGHPGESQETIDETKRWLLDVRPDELDITIITPYPGSPYYDEAVESSPGVWTYTYQKNGDRLHAQEIDYSITADYYKGDPNGGYRSYIHTDFLSSERIVALRDDLERDVRHQLGIPFPTAQAPIRYEHSMGQSNLKVAGL